MLYAGMLAGKEPVQTWFCCYVKIISRCYSCSVGLTGGDVVAVGASTLVVELVSHGTGWTEGSIVGQPLEAK